NETATTAQTEKYIEINSFLKNNITTYNSNAHVFDYYSWLEDPERPGKPNPDLVADNVHPTKAGYQALAEAIYAAYNS
ncbi:MAG: hypothetical protein ACM3YE_01965, partial [Bacteroidota bacterium]